MPNFAMMNQKLVGGLIGQSIPPLIPYYQNDQLVKNFSLDQINEAFAASNSREVMKPILIINETYKP